MVIMLLLAGLGMFGSSGFKFNGSSSSRPKRDNTLLKIGIGLVLIPGITIGGALIAVGGGVFFAGNQFFLSKECLFRKLFALLELWLSKQLNRLII